MGIALSIVYMDLIYIWHQITSIYNPMISARNEKLTYFSVKWDLIQRFMSARLDVFMFIIMLKNHGGTMQNIHFNVFFNSYVLWMLFVSPFIKVN